MVNYERLSEVLAALAAIDPASYNAGTQATDAFDLASVFNRQLFIVIHLGAVGAAGKLDFKLQSSPPTGTPSWTDIPGASITQMTVANKIAIVCVKLDSFWNTLTPAQQAQTKLQGLATVTTNAVLFSAVIYGGNATYQPNSDNNLARVAQLVNLG